ncbi:hypothetical protein [Nocardioides zeae]|uniref:Uncharacterized protein n=1 Tax=Nocardioides zeae TaxID=1457234 RepID=A0A6P0HLI1_9ACTN|nr:hypothetical protein [Nocardioides zeae]NEN79473.1 hypothetical protein [Nocardioides zeae]
MLELDVDAVTTAGTCAAAAGERLAAITTPDALAGVAGALGLGQTPAAVAAVTARWEGLRTALATGMTTYGAGLVEAAATVQETDLVQVGRYDARTPL